MKNNLIDLKKILFLIGIQIFLTQSLLAESIKNFKIKGNNRVADETIIMFSALEIGDNVSNVDLNNALKKLYYTDYFKDVEIKLEDQTVFINVTENPIIQSVVVEGVEKNSINDKIKEITVKIEKYPFVESKINDQVKLLKNLLKSYGYYFVKLETSIIQNNNNTVDLKYNYFRRN